MLFIVVSLPKLPSTQISLVGFSLSFEVFHVFFDFFFSWDLGCSDLGFLLMGLFCLFGMLLFSDVLFCIPFLGCLNVTLNVSGSLIGLLCVAAVLLSIGFNFLLVKFLYGVLGLGSLRVSEI